MASYKPVEPRGGEPTQPNKAYFGLLGAIGPLVLIVWPSWVALTPVPMAMNSKPENTANVEQYMPCMALYPLIKGALKVPGSNGISEHSQSAANFCFAEFRVRAELYEPWSTLLIIPSPKTRHPQLPNSKYPIYIYMRVYIYMYIGATFMLRGWGYLVLRGYPLKALEGLEFGRGRRRLKAGNLFLVSLLPPKNGSREGNWYVVCCPSASGKSLWDSSLRTPVCQEMSGRKRKKEQQSEMFCHGRRIIKNKEARGFKRDLLRRGRMIKMYCFLSDMWE